MEKFLKYNHHLTGTNMIRNERRSFKPIQFGIFDMPWLLNWIKPHVFLLHTVVFLYTCGDGVYNNALCNVYYIC